MSDTQLATTRKLPIYAQDADRPYEGDPWSQQKMESNKAYDAFRMYLSIEGRRTYAEVDRQYAAKYGVKLGKFSRCSQWAKKHRWEERALAYDNFWTAQQVAANKRALVKASAKHAEQAASVLDLLMEPVEEYRKRMKEQGLDSLLGDASDEQVMKLAVAFGKELPSMQRAERDALTSTGDTVVARTEIRAKGEIVKRMLADGTVRELAERVAFEVVSPVGDQSED